MIWSRIINFLRKKPDEIKTTPVPSDTRATVWMLAKELYSKDKSASKNSAYRIAIIMQNVKPEQWSDAYVQLRYAQIEPEFFDIARSLEPGVAVHLLGLATLNMSGFVRERALRELAKYKHPETLPYLLLRLNDWAVPVSKVAQQILLDNLTEFSATQFAKYFKLVEALEHFERVDLTKVREEIFVWMHKLSNREELLQRGDSGATSERVFCFKMLASVLKEDPDIVRRALRNTAPEVRTWAVAHLKVLSDWEVHLRNLFPDRSTRVRLKAVHFVQEHCKGLFDDDLHKLIFDDYRTVREVSRVILKDRGVSNFQALYRQKLHSEGCEGILAGYIEVSDASICDELKTYLGAKPKLRAIALLGLAKFRYADVAPECIKAIMVNNHRLRAVAVEILMRPQVIFDANALRNLPKSVALPSRRAALKILAVGDRLQVLRDLLFVFVHDEELRSQAYRYLSLKYDRDRVYPYFTKNDVLKAEIENLGQSAIQIASDDQKALMQSALNLVRKFA